MPVLSHLVSGTVYDIFGVALASATVTLTHTGQDQTLPSVTSGSDGKYIINLSGLDSQWSKGDAISVTATKTAEGTKTVETTIQGVGGQTVNLTLAETSDLSYYENTGTGDQYNLVFSLLTHYDGEKVTKERPLPVLTSDMDLLNNPSTAWTYDSKGRTVTETRTIRGTQYRRTFTYTGNAWQPTTRSEWVKI